MKRFYSPCRCKSWRFWNNLYNGKNLVKMDEFRRNFAGTDIQHPFQDNFLSKLRRWCLSYLARSTLGLCIHPILNFQFCWLSIFAKRQTSRIHQDLVRICIHFGNWKCRKTFFALLLTQLRLEKAWLRTW